MRVRISWRMERAVVRVAEVEGEELTDFSKKNRVRYAAQPLRAAV